MRLGFILFYIFISIKIINAQIIDNIRINDIASQGTGYNGVTQSFFINPSLVANFIEKNIYISYLNKYQVDDLSTLSSAFIIPNKSLPFSIDISSFGYDDYRESQFRTCLAKRISKKISLGVSFQYYIIQSILYEENPSMLSIDIGICYNPVDKVIIGMSINNIPRIYLNHNTADLKQFHNIFAEVGYQYKLIDNLLIIGTITCREKSKIIISSGFSFKIIDDFLFRAGISSLAEPVMGLGYKLKRFKFDVVAKYHSDLGLSSGISLTFLL